MTEDHSYLEWSTSDAVEDLKELYRHDMSQALENMFPDRGDGSRDAGFHTVITKEAWEDMLSRYLEQTFEMTEWQKKWTQALWDSVQVDTNDWRGRYLPGGDGRGKAVIADPENPRRGVPQYFVGGRRNGRSLMYSTIDEWHDSTYPPKIDLNRLQDPDYIRELQENINARIEAD